MNLMAIDASTKSTGIAIFKDNQLIHYECITASSQDCYKRIKKMWLEIEKLYNKYNIDTIIMEDILPEDVKHNQNVFNALHYLQAWIILHFHDYNQKVNLVSATKWRLACHITVGRYGYRETVKQQSINFVKEKYNIDANDDICDSICIGWSYLNDAATLAQKKPSGPIGEEESAF